MSAEQNYFKKNHLGQWAEGYQNDDPQEQAPEVNQHPQERHKDEYPFNREWKLRVHLHTLIIILLVVLIKCTSIICS